MRHQPISDCSFSEAEALRLVRALGAPGMASARRARPRQDAGEDRSRRSVLARTIEDEVIPRLVMARQPQHFGCTLPAGDPARLAPGDVAALVGLLMNGSHAQTIEFIESLHDAGVALDSLCLELLTPAARQLGLMWEEDVCSFTDVTVGVLRLSNVMRLISGAFAEDATGAGRAASPRALLAQMPGEQHGLGLAMLVYFFRRAGWQVHHAPVIGSAELVGLVRRQSFNLVGISVACVERMEALTADIRAIRAGSRNKAVGIMVGGPPFIQQPGLADAVGADATAADGRLAVLEANNLVSRLAHPNLAHPNLAHPNLAHPTLAHPE